MLLDDCSVNRPDNRHDDKSDKIRIYSYQKGATAPEAAQKPAPEKSIEVQTIRDEHEDSGFELQ